ncbi:MULTISPECIES: transcription termination factor NusA [Anaerococcus]|uniref:Transcription termination/antitermination protein NusA n=1 Tax=Anaerococcus nagyae TaxID=1755241 RepID=A0A3E2TJ72_9FIRM|nr:MULTISPECIES: transcription termination factor NusA [Anaerococcus]MBP2070364.1 N utilization substance protein A [Anaerococcus nagyae]MDU1828585.1 transcription termination factor NusA [Anaerococcus sp.]MDU1864654.1 transcription termination factor NusA [Anaerococcus sp.]MDU2353083.1 transcription termination factor NusA [Anaerococcus sp.]MDU2566181.1 transcription termination factor NusA [Anaerococcus sp.]
MNEDFILALDELEKDKNIDKEVILEALEKALIKSYQKNYDNAENVDVIVDKQTGDIEVFALREVVDDVNDNINQISLKEAKEIDKNLDIGDVARIKIAPKNFGRVAAQTARNIVIQKIRDAQRDSVYGEYLDRENEMITGTIQREDSYNLYVNLDKIEGVVPLKEQVVSEKYIPNERMKFLIKDVKSSSKEPQIVLSRSSEILVTRLFELEVPEITEGVIEIYSIAREAGSRTKIAVFSNDEAIDPVGACIGYKGARVNSIVEELQNEKIDIINYDKSIEEFISNALSPADIVEVLINEKNKQSLVVVNDYQLSLAIGKEGQNARLAARLTGWKIDIKSKTDFDNMSEEEIDQILGLNQEENTLEKTKEDIDLICVEDRSENQETIDNASGKLSDKKADDIENCTLEDAYNGKDLLSSQDDLKEIDLDGVYEAESDLILHGQEDKSEEDSEI